MSERGMSDNRPILRWRQPVRDHYETTWATKRLMICKRGPKLWDCWVEYANTARGGRPFTRTTRATLKAAQAWCADIVLLNPPIHKTQRFKADRRSVPVRT